MECPLRQVLWIPVIGQLSITFLRQTECPLIHSRRLLTLVFDVDLIQIFSDQFAQRLRDLVRAREWRSGVPTRTDDCVFVVGFCHGCPIE